VSGLVALGDSITRGGGEPLLGLPGRPWVELLADALGLACENVAHDGATASDVLREQVPRVAGTPAVACLYVGVNDARDPGWDADVFARDLGAVLGALARAAPVLLAGEKSDDVAVPRVALDLFEKPVHASFSPSRSCMNFPSLKSSRPVIPPAVLFLRETVKRSARSFFANGSVAMLT